MSSAATQITRQRAILYQALPLLPINGINKPMKLGGSYSSLSLKVLLSNLFTGYQDSGTDIPCTLSTLSSIQVSNTKIFALTTLSIRLVFFRRRIRDISPYLARTYPPLGKSFSFPLAHSRYHLFFIPIKTSYK
jgi:hypothetical protein